MLEQGKLVQDMLRLEAAFDPGIYRVELAHIKERTCSRLRLSGSA
jgi:hypothetical protein